MCDFLTGRGHREQTSKADGGTLLHQHLTQRYICAHLLGVQDLAVMICATALHNMTKSVHNHMSALCTTV